MIKDSKQYEITKKQAEKFRVAIRDFNPRLRKKQKIDEELIKAELAGLESMYETLLDEMQEYENRNKKE